MNVHDQLQKTDVDLQKTTLADLISELKQRCNAVVVVMAVDDDENGDETTITYRLGSRLVCLGALEHARAEIIEKGFPQEEA